MGSGTAPDTDEGDNFFHDYHPRVLILLLLKGTTFYYKMGQPSVIKKLVMKNYEGGGEKFLPVTCMGSGTGTIHSWRDNFSYIFGTTFPSTFTPVYYY